MARRDPQEGSATRESGGGGHRGRGGGARRRDAKRRCRVGLPCKTCSSRVIAASGFSELIFPRLLGGWYPLLTPLAGPRRDGSAARPSGPRAVDRSHADYIICSLTTRASNRSYRKIMINVHIVTSITTHALCQLSLHTHRAATSTARTRRSLRNARTRRHTRARAPQTRGPSPRPAAR